MKKLPEIAFLIFLLVATSCVSRKKSVAPTQPQSFEWLSAKLDIQAEVNGQSFNDLSGQLRMRKDSIVWMSVTATMGMEVLRAKISTDSIWILNRMDKTYLAESLDTVSSQLGMPLSLSWVQNMLLDNNEGFAPVENQTVQLKNFALGNYTAKVRYSNIRLDEMTTFPLKITNKMERMRLPIIQ